MRGPRPGRFRTTRTEKAQMSATLFTWRTRSHIAGLVFAVSVMMLYAPVIAKLLSDWWEDPDYSHAFLVAPLAAFLVWQRRAELIHAERSGSTIGLAVACGALLLLIAGTLGA